MRIMEREQHEAGRKLDALIAERLMGYTDVHFNGPTDRLANLWYGHAPGEEWHSEPPEYSTDMAEAWKVVERLVALGYWISLSHNGNTHAAAWDFRIVDRKNERDRHITISETAPLAICCTALKAQIEESAAEAATTGD